MKQFYMILASVSIATSPLYAQDFETAQEAAQNMGIGWNLGNTFDSNSGDAKSMWIEQWTDCKPSDFETAWGQPVTTRQLIHMFKEAGFKTIRIPVTWYPHIGNTIGLCKANNGVWDMSKWQGMDVDKAWMARVKEVVDYVIEEDMYCILNVHHDTGGANTAWIEASMDSYNNYKERFESLWTQIATEFRDYDQRLLFGGYNEMLDKYDSWCFATFNTSNKYIEKDAKDAYEAVNSYAQSFVNAVRATGGNNTERNLIVNTYGSCNGSGTWNQHLDDPLIYMELPEDSAKDHIIFDVHSYFDHTNLSGAKKDIDAVISDVDKYLKSKGAPVMFSEWGTTADIDKNPTDLCEYARYFVEQTKAAGIPICYWMVLSEGNHRSIPKWSAPDLKDAIVKGYYGDAGYSAVESVETAVDDSDAPIFNLQGIRVTGTPAPGIYIRKGKKIIINR